MKRIVNSSKQFLLMIVKAKDIDKSDAFQGYNPKQKVDLVKVVSDYDILFQEPKGLPPKREIEHEIYLQQDAPLPNIGMYKLSALENVGIKKKVQELLDQGFIRPSTSLCGSPIVLVRKKDGSWRICIDVRVLTPNPCSSVEYSKTNFSSNAETVSISLSFFSVTASSTFFH